MENELDKKYKQAINLLKENPHLKGHTIQKLIGVSKNTGAVWVKRINEGVLFRPKQPYAGHNNIKAYNEKMKRDGKPIDWGLIQREYDSGLTYRDIEKKYKISQTSLSKASKEGLLKTLTHGQKRAKRVEQGLLKVVTQDETKKNISKARKEFIKNNPDKHGWQNSRHNKSSWLCENAKNYLKSLGANFKEEWMPLAHEGRYFSLDIAFPEKMIAIEINGKQHYESHCELAVKVLKPYYQERHNLIENAGWKIYELDWAQSKNYELLKSILIDNNLL